MHVDDKNWVRYTSCFKDVRQWLLFVCRCWSRDFLEVNVGMPRFVGLISKRELLWLMLLRHTKLDQRIPVIIHFTEKTSFIRANMMLFLETTLPSSCITTNMMQYRRSHAERRPALFCRVSLTSYDCSLCHI